jgi:hypothetical protein
MPVARGEKQPDSGRRPALSRTRFGPEIASVEGRDGELTGIPCPARQGGITEGPVIVPEWLADRPNKRLCLNSDST